jgi:hypothetical protein
MKLAPFKYVIVVLLLGIFLARGVAYMYPLYSFLNLSSTDQDFMMNTEEEKNSEKNTGKLLSEREFITESSDSFLIAPAYTILADKLLSIHQHYIQDVFLPVNTPPPRKLG